MVVNHLSTNCAEDVQDAALLHFSQGYATVPSQQTVWEVGGEV